MAADRWRHVQLALSLLVAAAIVAITVSLVTAQLPLREIPHEQQESHGGGNSGPG
jgi:hypothetical protein